MAVAGTAARSRSRVVVDVGLAGGGEQSFQMRGVLDGHPGVVGAVMVGQLGLCVEDADAGG